jgi:SAM-dependent methyltransferase
MLASLRKLFQPSPSREKLEVTTVTSLAEYQSHLKQMQKVHEQRWELELDLARGQDPIVTRGICYPCDKEVDFVTDFSYCATMEDGTRIPNWRERVLCPCVMSNRARAAIHLVEGTLGAKRKHDLYIAEQVTPLYRTLAKRFPTLIGSEYLGDEVSFGTLNAMGLRNESVTQLSFGDASFDYALNFDVLEHIPEPKRGLAELQRVLRPGGALLLSVPFMPDAEASQQRARIAPDGSVEHLLPPFYHGDPVSTAGCLCFTDFGWDLLDDMRAAGFRRAELALFWSDKFGYYGVEQMMFVARK